MAQLVWRFEGRLTIAVHGKSDPSNLEWAGYLRDTVAQPKPSMLKVLVISHGGGPTGAQRKQLTDSLKQSVPTAFLSDKFLARSLVNTLSWFNPTLRALRPTRANVAITVGTRTDLRSSSLPARVPQWPPFGSGGGHCIVYND